VRWRNWWSIVVTVGLFAAGIGIFLLASRVTVLDGDLDDARTALEAARRTSENMSEGVVETTEDLESLTTELEAARAKVAELRAIVERQRAELESKQESIRNARGCGADPHLELVPEAAAIGRRVVVLVDCVPRDWSEGNGLLLLRDFTSADCNFVGGGGRVPLKDNGRGRGQMVIPATGICAGSAQGHRVTPGEYRIALGCRKCITNATLVVRQRS
jgi:hypothetical protein